MPRTERDWLADAALVHAAREDVTRLMGDWRQRPLEPEAVYAFVDWAEDEYPRAWAAMQRLQAATPHGQVRQA